MSENEKQLRYEWYKKAIHGTRLPAACVDLELLDKNILVLRKRSGSKPIRIATKSIRSLFVLKYIQERLENTIGFMSFSLSETCYLVDNGLDNILVGYPTMHEPSIKEVGGWVKKGKKIVLMVDKEEHIALLSKVGMELSCTFSVCIDADVSTKFPGVYFGVYRSSVRSNEDFKELLSKILSYNNVEPVGLMGYEAQIAGVSDGQNGKRAKSSIVKALKKRSIPKIAAKRRMMVALYKGITNCDPVVANAGGTGSIESSISEDWVNEVTVGSGFFQPTLFDDYNSFKHEPAAFFVLEVARHPEPDIYTLNGGGYIASGSCDPSKLPTPYLPVGMRLENNEGAGEVQTPIHYSGKLDLGEPVFFRHAKAGELCERFNTLHLIRNDEIVDVCTTYRGDGYAFL